MTRDQLNVFVYSCLSFANTAHFDEDRFIKGLLNKGLNRSTFSEVIMRNYDIANNQHFGVCFTMTCWAYHLLYTMGIDSGYYILETVEKKTGFPNYVLLYKFEEEYCICDLAAQIQAIEEAHNTLFHIAREPDYYDKDTLENALKTLANPKFVHQSLGEYYKDYSGGILVDATGIEDDRIFTEIPQLFLIDFLKREKNVPSFK